MIVHLLTGWQMATAVFVRMVSFTPLRVRRGPSRTGRQRWWLAAGEQALELSSQIEDELLRAHVHGYCAYWR
ncbi:MAG TPA: hypothetical protein VKK06_13810, partial [Terriglobia bacterium]|nr:hypothetical protein [Terriglobia bacterium]